ncbi:hypothetical protein DOY81_004811 [Sarcophaga bullata]|nr:hypothetical protein DOY81_004811 [Sarcophaga bullata]
MRINKVQVDRTNILHGTKILMKIIFLQSQKENVIFITPLSEKPMSN